MNTHSARRVGRRRRKTCMGWSWAAACGVQGRLRGDILRGFPHSLYSSGVRQIQGTPSMGTLNTRGAFKRTVASEHTSSLFLRLRTLSRDRRSAGSRSNVYTGHQTSMMRTVKCWHTLLWCPQSRGNAWGNTTACDVTEFPAAAAVSSRAVEVVF